jgi:hypothetical protein
LHVAIVLAVTASLLPVGAFPAGAVSDPQVVATGLNAPYKLTQGPGGAIFVVESGTGGPDCSMIVGPEGEEVEVCTGDTGSVTRILGTEVSKAATGLPSALVGEEPLGPTAIDFDPSGQMHVLVGLGGDVATRDSLGDDRFGTLLRVPSSGAAVIVADLVAFEETNDPDAGDPGHEGPDSNPFGLAFDGPDPLVADAGGNDLLRVNSDGSITVEATFPPTFVDPPPFIPAPGQIPMQSVPTSVEVDASGDITVSELTGFPFVPGEADIWSVDGAAPTSLHSGFTNIIDHAVAGDGTMYVLEFASNGLLSEVTQPALVQVRTDGTRKTLLYGDELPVPGGVAVGSDGMVYLSVCTLCGPGEGMVWRINPAVASDAATALACSPAEVPGTDFADIAPNPHREAIECAAWWGVVNGFSPTSFGPLQNITREQVASMLARALRAAGVVLVLGAPDAFTDDDGSPHESDINALAAAGIIKGVTETTFAPKAPVTREQVASLVARAYAVAAGEALAAGPNAFTDDESSGHQTDINDVANAGWVNGIGGGLFLPGGNTSRDQFSSIVTRMLSTLVEEGLASLPS